MQFNDFNIKLIAFKSLVITFICIVLFCITQLFFVCAAKFIVANMITSYCSCRDLFIMFTLIIILMRIRKLELCLISWVFFDRISNLFCFVCLVQCILFDGFQNVCQTNINTSKKKEN